VSSRPGGSGPLSTSPIRSRSRRITLWDLPNVLISPHMAGDSPGSTIRSFELAGDQVRRFAAGEPLINEVARYLLE